MSFKSWDSYPYFFREVTRKNRYIYSDEVMDFLSNVLETSRSRMTPVESGKAFWRAQLGSEKSPLSIDEEITVSDFKPFSEERMKPVAFEATEGRVNPKGIPCLYLATTKETAMAEARPSLDAIISVGQFQAVKDLRLIDCSQHPPAEKKIYSEEPDDQTKEMRVWEAIDEAFSEPVTPSDKASDYVPTQIIAELFKRNGYDGVFYRSSLSDGLNLALFDIKAAAIVDRFLYTARQIKYSFEQRNPIAYDTFNKRIPDNISFQTKARKT